MPRTKKTLEPNYVISFIARFSAVVLVGFSIFGIFIVILTNKKIGPTYSEGMSALNQMLAYLPFAVFITAFTQTLSLCIIAMFLALLWSHSVAGPLVRFRNHLKNITYGKSINGPLAFRGGDQLHALALAFSEMIISRRDSSTKTLVLLLEAEKKLSECEALEKQGKSSSHEFDRKLRELKSIYPRIKDVHSIKKPRR